MMASETKYTAEHFIEIARQKSIDIGGVGIMNEIGATHFIAEMLVDILDAAESVLTLKCPSGVGYKHAFEAKYCLSCGGKHGLCPFMKLNAAVERIKGENQ